MTPEDQVEAMRQAKLRVLALRGEDPETMVRQADTLQGIGGALAGLGGRPVQEMSKDLVGRGDTLRQLVGRNSRYEKTPEELDAMAARADYERAKAAGYGKPKPVDPLARRKLGLQIRKMENELSGGEEGPKEADVRGWSSQIPEGVKNIFTNSGKARAIAEEAGGFEALAGVGVFAGKIAPVLLPEKERDFRQYSAAAANAYRKIFAGAAVSPEEGAQINRAIAQVESGKTAREVATGLVILEQFATDAVDQGLAGASPDIKARIVPDIMPKAKGKGVKSGNTNLDTPAVVTVRRRSDGKTKTVPAASAEKYLKDPAFERVE